MTVTASSLHCRVCSGRLDPEAVKAGQGRHLVAPDTPDSPEVMAAGSAAMAMVIRQRQACALGRMIAGSATGVWLATGTGDQEPYPCRCAQFDTWQHDHGRCPCNGRSDTAHLPAGCCAYTPTPARGAAPPPAPAEAPQPDPEPEDEPTSTVDELRVVLIDYELSRPRSRQVELGPSELGTPCVAQMARKIARLPRKDVVDPAWAPFQGVAVHAQMENVVEHWNNAIGRQRWIAEDSLHISADISGHGDAFDTDQDMVVDWKHVGTTALDKLSAAQRAGKPPAEQVSQGYRIQAHLYGLGHERKGRTVRWVRLVLLARSWRYDDSAEWTERYNPELARWAVNRYRSTVSLLDALGVADGSPDLIAAIPRSPGDCTWCPFYRPGRPNDSTGCPGDESIVRKAHERISSGLIATGMSVTTVATTDVI